MGRPLPTPSAAAGLQGPAPSLDLQGIEITQVVQDLASSVPLIAGKRTVVRAYPSLPAGGGSLLIRGELSITGSDGVTRQVPSLNGTTIAPTPAGGVSALREKLDLSLNFLLPGDALAAGNANLQLVSVTDSSGRTLSFNGGSPAPASITFVAAPPLRVKIFAIRYSDGQGTYHPTERDYQLTLSWFRRVYPTAEVIATRLTIDAPKAWPFACEDVNLQLAAIRRQDIAAGADARVHYFGMVADAGGRNFMRGCASDVPDHPAPDTVASGPAGAAGFPWDTDGSYADWYTGHEVGHTFGRAHPGFCNQTHDDPDFPFANGQISNADGWFVGLDVGDDSLGIPMQALPSLQWSDVMTYCDRQWMCSYTFEKILQRLQDENAAPGPGTVAGVTPLAAAPAAVVRNAPAKLVHVLARVNTKAETGKLHSVLPVAKGVPSRPEPASAVSVEFLNENDQVLSSRHLRIKTSTCCEEREERPGMIDALLVLPDGARSVRLKWKERELDRVSATGAAQQVAEFRPQAAAAAAAAIPAEPAAAPARVTVQTSTDGGATWETVAVNVSATAWRPEPRNYRGHSRILVRFISSDGFQSTSTVTEVNLG